MALRSSALKLLENSLGAGLMWQAILITPAPVFHP